MRVVFFSYGTRGDAQPQVVLASTLQERGYQVRVCAPENLRAFVEASGIEYAPLFGNSQEILESEDGRRWLRSGNVRAFMKAAAEIVTLVNPEVFKGALAAVQDADAIVGGTLAENLAFTLAEHKKLPLVLGHTIPYETTGAYPSPLVTRARLPLSSLNRLTHALFRKLAWGIHRDTLNPFRVSLGLAPLSSTIVGAAHTRRAAAAAPGGERVLQLWSEHVLPHPADAAPHVATTGYLRVPPALRERLGEAKPPPTLVDWLARGKPPVYFGFGSMPVLDPRAMAQQVLDVATALDVRVVLSAGWTRTADMRSLTGDRLRVIDAVDHGWLLPQCAAAVHHGGAGTTAASLEAGAPTLVCSVFADQPFWGERVARLGVGAHVPFAKLSPESLADGLRAVLGDDVRARAASLAARLRGEDGVATAVAAIVARIGAPRSSTLAA